eukprot:577305-Alexandrium_andersonii.AAC.1
MAEGHTRKLRRKRKAPDVDQIDSSSSDSDSSGDSRPDGSDPILAPGATVRAPSAPALAQPVLAPAPAGAPA